MGKGWRIATLMLIILLMMFALLGSNNVMLSNPEKGTFMYALKNVDIYLEGIFDFILKYLRSL